MATTMITCPSCGNEFEPNNVIREQIQTELRTTNERLAIKKRRRI